MTTAADNMRKVRANAADLAKINPPKDMERRLSCLDSLERFIRTYRAGFDKIHFKGDLFDDQVEQIQAVQDCILNGERFALAAMRGGGKSSILRAGLVWGLLYGHISFGVLIGATANDSANHLFAVQGELESNDLLFEDFPEVCVPVRALGGSSRRCTGQTCCGVRTGIGWGSKEVITPLITADQCVDGWIDGVQHGAKNYIMEKRSMDGAIRGLNRGGMRPSFIGIDDAETRDSVRSYEKTKNIRLKIDTDIGGLGSQKVSMGVVFLGTIMDEESVTAEFTDPKKRPTWNGKRYSYMKTMPKKPKLWAKYVSIRQDTAFGGVEKAREFYAENREKMDAGAECAWVDGFDPTKYASAVEKFYAEQADKKENGLEYIACELQNDPSLMRSGDESRLTREMVCGKLSGMERRRVPHEVKYLTGFVDVHQTVGHQYWCVIGWATNYNGWVLDYGRWPERGNIMEKYPGNPEASSRAALDALYVYLSGIQWVFDSGVEITPKIGVDSNQPQMTSQVYDFCRTAKYRNLVPTAGESSKGKDFNSRGLKDDRRGDNWREAAGASDRLKIPVIRFNADYWKRFTINRLLSPRGNDGCLQLFGDNPVAHSEIATHLTSERPRIFVEKGTNREIETWERVPNMPNHWFDCVVGATMMANVCGCRMVSGQVVQRRKRPLRRAR